MEPTTASSGFLKVLSCFLIKFDVKLGNSLVWSKSDSGIDLQGIEFRAIPSSLHNKQRDIIIFDPGLEIGLPDTIGVSVYIRRVRQPDSASLSSDLTATVDRSLLDMYCFGVILPKYCKYWYIIPDLEFLLNSYMSNMTFDYDDPAELYTGMSKLYTDGFDPSSATSSQQHHHEAYYPLSNTTNLISQYGPFMFSIWRACLLRQKVLLVNDLHGSLDLSVDQFSDTNTGSSHMFATDFKSFSDYVHIIGLLSIIPEDTKHFVPVGSFDKIRANLLFNVGISDLANLTSTNNGLQGGNGYIATTTDVIMSQKSNVFDLAVISDGREHRIDNQGICSLLVSRAKQPYLQTSCNPVIPFSRYISSTWRWAKSFLPQSFSGSPSINISESLYEVSAAPDIATATRSDKLRYDFIKAALHITAPDSSDYDYGSSFYNKSVSIFEEASYSFLWWASAGSPLTQSYTNDPQGFSLMETWVPHEGSSEIDIPISIVGYFHHLTRKLFSKVYEIIQRQSNYSDDDVTSDALSLLQHDITPVLIDPINMVEMGLDPLCSSDVEFLAAFVKTWWDRPTLINSVSWGLCCT